jgi:hypothetical protein
MTNKKTIKVRDLKPNKDAKGGGAAVNRTGTNSTGANHTGTNSSGANSTRPQGHGHHHN